MSNRSKFQHSRDIPLKLAFLAGLVLFAGAGLAAGNDPVEFNRDIRQLLSDNCFQCHGPDKNTRKADLRLDTVEGAFRDLGGYRTVVPGDPEKSEIYRRIATSDPDDLMPPPDSGKSLTAQQKQLFRRWIAEGAEYRGHWAYLPPKRHDLPPVKQAGWPANPIDFFVLRKIEQAGLAPSSEAGKRTLIRRVYLDLIGLPPSPEEVRAFLEDDHPNAFEQVVDDLLRRPQYGERRAMHWLDLVRYADTVGYHGDQPYSVWPYRDYVIRAFNDNLPFDRFTIEQLAGDLLPNPTRDQLVASGYNRLNMITAEGGAQDKEYLAKYAADRVRTTSTTWMGATMGCAECHDHKFDPFTMKDFYSMEAFFADLEEKGFYGGANRDGRWGPMMQLPTPGEEARLKEFDATIAQLESQLATHTPALQTLQNAWENRLRELHDDLELAWRPLKPLKVSAKKGAKLHRLQNYSVRARGDGVKNDTFTVEFETGRAHITGLLLEALPTGPKDKKRMGMNGGNFILSGFEVDVVGGNGKPVSVKIASAKADYSQKNFEIEKALDGKSDTGWAVDGQKKIERRKAVFTFDQPLPGGPGTQLVVRLKHESKQAKHLIGRFRISLSSVDRPTLDRLAMPKERWQIVNQPAKERSKEEAAELAKFYRSFAPLLDPVRDELAKQEKGRKALDAAIATTLISRQRETPRPIRILSRGNWLDDSGPLVKPAVPEFLQSEDRPDKDRLSRLDLAQWLVSRENPVTARVVVNRFWKQYFGTGLSKVLDDLGSQGEWPTHPDLLDWLAVEFMDSGWNVKHLVKLIVTSSTYRQSSAERPELTEADPYNRLLARQGRFRLPAETIRDNALAVSGLLVREIGGPSVKPYQPKDYYAQLNFPKREYQPDTGSEQYRRGVYTHWQRTFLHPMLKAFDAPSREECTAERPHSNTPLQALALLNDPSYVEAARKFAERILREGGHSPEERLDWAFEQALARLPKPKEKQLLLDLRQQHAANFRKEKNDAFRLLDSGDSAVPEDLELPELAAWTSVSRTLLNLHETITRY